MITVHSFTFNPFAENTYVLADATKACIIIDPGCYTPEEEAQLAAYIADHGLKPERLLNTHCHIDHVFGNRFVADRYGLSLEIPPEELPMLQAVPAISQVYQIPLRSESPEPQLSLHEGDTVRFGQSELKILFVPGHSPGHVAFYQPEDRFVVAGDVLFYGSIGRTDLPGGDYDTLINSIRKQLLPLGDDVVVYPGHGEPTKIGFERRNNTYLKRVSRDA
ncbi:MAG: MBL fold metallo-hydrolase [Bacteroidota bacterium]